MNVSRYFGIPLLAAVSLAVSLALLPLEPAGANHVQTGPAASLAGPA